MATSMKVFRIDETAYQNISEGNAQCSFRMPYRSQRDNALRIVIASTLPPASFADFDLFYAPEARLDERVITLADLDKNVYVRLHSESSKGYVPMAVYRA